MKLILDYKKRRAIRMLVWILALSWVGAKLWPAESGLLVGAIIGFLIALGIDEKFYIVNGRN